MSDPQTASPQAIYSWFISSDGQLDPGLPLCQSRDQLNARIERLLSNFQGHPDAAGDLSLLAAVVGEIGNNCFDHNLGLWTDCVGAILSWGQQGTSIWVVISDRGQGLFSSLSRVVPELKSSQEALDVAFHKRITGRAPERRGNGLKFVRESINEREGRGLFFQTNGASHVFGSRGQEVYSLLGQQPVPTAGPAGTFAVILWGLES